MSPQNQETHLKVLRHLEDNPNVTQRELAAELGISLGKANYCLNVPTCTFSPRKGSRPKHVSR